MGKSNRFLAAFLAASLFSIAAIAQTITISGTVRNSSSKSSLSSATVNEKGTSNSTFTNPDGGFSLKVTKLPVVLIVSSAEFTSKEITVSDASLKIEVELDQNIGLVTDVVVSASRSQEISINAPVTIESLRGSRLRSIAAPSVYEGLGNLKGVDVHVASLTFKTITTRGFVSSGNTRLNQLVDGMDNQAPGLNFSVSTIVGLADVDIDNIEVLSGASSALYGSGGMNGTVLVTSKNPFKYKGLSFNIKQGLMHVDNRQRDKAPYSNWSFRWAQAFNDKVAFKVTAELLRGSDWQAEDYRNKAQIGILSNVIGGNRSNDPNFNGINIYGDETAFNMNGFSFYVQDQTRRSLLAATGVDIINHPALGANAYFGVPGDASKPGVIGLTPYPTNAQISTWLAAVAGAGFPAPAITAIQQMLPFYIGLNRGYFKNYNVSRTGYEEKYLVDYNTLNVKVNGGIHWKITPNIEASWNTYFGTGTTVYTGADRYSLRNFKIAQHKLEFKGKSWLLRGYTTQENAGESYIAGALGAFMNEAYSPSSVWFPTYIGTFSETRRQAQGAQSDITIHNNVRAIVDAARLIPGTPAFDAAAQKIKSIPVNQAGGSRFLDKSDLWAADGQLNLSDVLEFSNTVEVIAGAQWKQWILNSKGTIFNDIYAPIKVNETGGFVQLRKKFMQDVLTLSASGRYDKQTNYKGKFTPRLTAVIRVAKDNNIRLSFQTAYRFPSNQNQYINLRLGGGSSFLIGSLPEFQTLYKLNSTLPGYTAASVLSYRSGTIGDSNRLVQAVFNPLKPESVNSYEIGYKGILGKKMLIDAYLYYSQYQDFIISTAVVQSTNGPKYEIYSPFSTSISYNQNSSQKVKSFGWGIGVEYQLIQRFLLYGNVFSDELKDVPASEVTFFNAPKYRFNIGLRNENVYRNVGFNVVVKWQDNNYYEGTFVTGTLPYFAWVDAQVTYHPPKTKSYWRFGGSNVGNSYYRTGFGSPAVGGVYYISYGYNLY